MSMMDGACRYLLNKTAKMFGVSTDVDREVRRTQGSDGGGSDVRVHRVVLRNLAHND
jgi:hypothetical protein